MCYADRELGRYSQRWWCEPVLTIGWFWAVFSSDRGS